MKFIPTIRCRELSAVSPICEGCWLVWDMQARMKHLVARWQSSLQRNRRMSSVLFLSGEVEVAVFDGAPGFWALVNNCPKYPMTSEIERSLAEFEALNLAGGCLWQFRNKFHAAWPFVIRKMRHDKFLKPASKLCIVN